VIGLFERINILNKYEDRITKSQFITEKKLSNRPTLRRPITFVCLSPYMHNVTIFRSHK